MDRCVLYCLGAMALLGCGCPQARKAAPDQAGPSVLVTAANPTAAPRPGETISIGWKDVAGAVPGLAPETVSVRDEDSGQFLVTQVCGAEGDALLLFQSDFAPQQAKSFRLMPLPDGVKRPRPRATTYCCFLPERHDDFAWENDRVAQRMYGPALEFETITSGVDAWGKCVPYPVVEKFIREYALNGTPYHLNHGEGGDFYKVGPSLGCGGMAPFADGRVRLPRNFTKWRVLANGPIRSVFELSYAPWEAGGVTVSETKRISIDLGSNMSRFECRYEARGADALTLAAGIVLRDTSDRTWAADGAIAYWLPTDFVEGMFGCGVVFGPGPRPEALTADGHLLLALELPAGEAAVYYAGSCWDENAEFDTFEKWQRYLAGFKDRIDHPVLAEVRR